MDTGDWIAVVAVLISVASVYYAHRSAKASETSAGAGQESARAAHESAQAARETVQIEAERRAEERERRHEDLGPPHPGEIVAELEESRGHAALFGSITVPRDYRVQAAAHMHGGSSTPLSLPILLEAHQPYRFMIEHWPPGQTAPRHSRCACGSGRRPPMSTTWNPGHAPAAGRCVRAPTA